MAGLYIDGSIIEMFIYESRLDCSHFFLMHRCVYRTFQASGEFGRIIVQMQDGLWRCVLFSISRFIHSIYRRHVPVYSFQHFLVFRKTAVRIVELIEKLGFAVRRDSYSYATSPPDSDAWWELSSTPA